MPFLSLVTAEPETGMAKPRFAGGAEMDDETKQVIRDSVDGLAREVLFEYNSIAFLLPVIRLEEERYDSIYVMYDGYNVFFNNTSDDWPPHPHIIGVDDPFAVETDEEEETFCVNGTIRERIKRAFHSKKYRQALLFACQAVSVWTPEDCLYHIPNADFACASCKRWMVKYDLPDGQVKRGGNRVVQVSSDCYGCRELVCEECVVKAGGYAVCPDCVQEVEIDGTVYKLPKIDGVEWVMCQDCEKPFANSPSSRINSKGNRNICPNCSVACYHCQKFHDRADMVANRNNMCQDCFDKATSCTECGDRIVHYNLIDDKPYCRKCYGRCGRCRIFTNRRLAYPYTSLYVCENCKDECSFCAKCGNYTSPKTLGLMSLVGSTGRQIMNYNSPDNFSLMNVHTGGKIYSLCSRCSRAWSLCHHPECNEPIQPTNHFSTDRRTVNGVSKICNTCKGEQKNNDNLSIQVAGEKLESILVQLEGFARTVGVRGLQGRWEIQRSTDRQED